MEIFDPKKTPDYSRETITDLDLNLFREIMHDFSHHPFTLRDVFDAYNLQETKLGSKKTTLGEENIKRSLDAFVREGWLDYDEKTKEYTVNHTSSMAAKMFEKDFE